jgi:predicted nucleic acid-binding protein
MKLLNSTFLAHYTRGADVVFEYLSEHEDEQFVTSTINVKEIAVGAHLVEDPTYHEILTDFGWVDIRPFSTEHAYFAGEIEAQLQDDPEIRQDRINSLMGDILIAGVAVALDAPIVTRNVDDFELFDGVSVETY